MIPAKAVEAAAKWLHDNDCPSALHSGFPADIECYDWIEQAKELLEAAAPYMTTCAPTAPDAEIDLHLIIKNLRVRSGSAAGMMVCSSEDRAQIVQAILAAGYSKP